MADRSDDLIRVGRLNILVRQAEPSDWPTVEGLLKSATLPVEDLGEDRLGAFLVAEIAGEIVGAVGHERYGDVGLLRSLVVREDKRNASLGRKLVEAIEAIARMAGIGELWLLTIDAERFFERRGYAFVDREAAPDAIRGTAEFSTLCPGTAFLMRKRLL